MSIIAVNDLHRVTDSQVLPQQDNYYSSVNFNKIQRYRQKKKPRFNERKFLKTRQIKVRINGFNPFLISSFYFMFWKVLNFGNDAKTLKPCICPEPMIPVKRQYRTLYLFSIDRLCHRKQYHVVMTDIQAVRTSVSLPQDSGAKKGRSYRLSYVIDSNICTLPCQYAREASIYEQIIGMRVPYSPKKK